MEKDFEKTQIGGSDFDVEIIETKLFGESITEYLYQPMKRNGWLVKFAGRQRRLSL